jgi:hypothetical protein
MLSASFHFYTKFDAYLQHHCKELLLRCNSQAQGLGRRRLCRVEFFGRSEHLLCPNWQWVWRTCRCTVMTSDGDSRSWGNYHGPTITEVVQCRVVPVRCHTCPSARDIISHGFSCLPGKPTFKSTQVNNILHVHLTRLRASVAGCTLGKTAHIF